MESNGWPQQAHPTTNRRLDELVLQLGHQSCARPTHLHTSVQALSDFIWGNKSVRILTDLMIRESQCLPKDIADLSAPIRDTTHLLELINGVISMAPTCSDVDNDGGLIGCPLNILFRRLMGTPSGWSFFDRPDVNDHLRAILTAWSQYLQLPDSTSVLSREDGWCSSRQLAILATAANRSPHTQTFQQIYRCPDPSDASTLGFSCWDDFFLREFQPGQRPLGAAAVDAAQGPGTRLPCHSYHDRPVDLLESIINPCESTPIRLVNNVNHKDTFWLKHQPYSLVDMLDSHWSLHRFAHGTIYQAFLSAFMYHRWHAPVSGRVVAIHHIKGTYFSQLPAHAGLEPSPPPSSPSLVSQTRSRSSSCSSFVLVDDLPGSKEEQVQTAAGHNSDFEGDPAPPNKSQPYLAAVATRLLILFAADCPQIGLVGFMAIGMAEVSSCEAIVEEGQHVQAGEQIGMFHYGGSSCCLLLEPAAANILSWQCNPIHDKDKTYRVNSVLAKVNV